MISAQKIMWPSKIGSDLKRWGTTIKSGDRPIKGDRCISRQTCRQVISEKRRDKTVKKELNSLSSDKRAVNGLSCALKARSCFRPGARDSTQHSTCSLSKTTLSRAYGEITNVLVGVRNHATTVGWQRTNQRCRLSRFVEEWDATAVRWIVLEISAG